MFTPKGDVITLPVGSTVIDFAYAIHTQVGNKMTGAKVGGRMANFEYRLKTGDIVEVMTSSSANYGPKRSWLEIAKTNEAKAKIRAWFKRECREENVEQGKLALETEFRRNNINADEEFILRIAERQRFTNVDDFYAAIGYGGVVLSKIMQKTKEDYLKLNRPVESVDVETTVQQTVAKRQSNGVVVEGIDNCLVRFARCCNPLPGDEITGFITRGYGVSVHKADCPNASHSADDERWIKVYWSGGMSTAYQATIDIVAAPRTGLIADITTVIAGNHIPINEINSHLLKNGNMNITLTIEISGVEQLRNLVSKIGKVQGVISAERTARN